MRAFDEGDQVHRAGATRWGDAGAAAGVQGENTGSEEEVCEEEEEDEFGGGAEVCVGDCGGDGLLSSEGGSGEYGDSSGLGFT